MLNILPWLGNVAAGVAAYLTAYVSAKAAAIAGVVAASALLFTGFALVITGIVSNISLTFPALASKAMVFVPGNLSIAISALITAKLARLAYEQQQRFLSLASAMRL